MNSTLNTEVSVGKWWVHFFLYKWPAICFSLKFQKKFIFFQDKTTHLWSIGNFLSIRRFHQFLFLFLKDFLLPCIYLTNPQINFVRRDAAKGEFNVYIIKLDRRWVRHSKTQKTEPCRIGLVAKFFCSTFWFVLVIIGVTAHGDIIIYTLSSDITFVIST